MKLRTIAAVVVLAAAVLSSACGAGTQAASAKIAPAVARAVAGSGSRKSTVLVLTASRSPLKGIQAAGVRVPRSTPRAVRVSATAAEIQKMARSADVIAIVPDEPPARPPVPGPQFRPELAPFADSRTPLPNTWLATDIVGARAAWDLGFTGKGVKVAVIDEGIDFGHPDLQGTQARVENPASPYCGWPIVFDPYSMASYATTGSTISTWYVKTRGPLTLENPVMGGRTWILPPTSKSNRYLWGLHPGYWLHWGWPYGGNARFLLVDENQPGVYDTVYVDLDKDRDFTDEKPCRKGDEACWHDLDGDGLADLSGGMIYWIADGVNPIPASDWLYNLPPPPNASIVCFTGSFGKYDQHGTLVASAIAAQGRIGVGEPDFRAEPGGVVVGSAPDAKLISIGSVYESGASMYDAILFSVLGYDGLPNTGDEADVVNMSFGYSTVDNDGWDYLARYITYLNVTQAPRTTFVAASGNGGPGYGTVTSPGSAPSAICVGASTLYGSVPVFEDIAGADQITFGDIQPWSNRGPSALGACEPDVVAVGAWATGDVPIYGSAEAGWGVWGGTSLASPITAGVVADIYEAYEAVHGVKPTYERARDLLAAGATDLGYPVLEQGAGQIDAARSVRMALGQTFAVTPTSWLVGRDAPAFTGTVEPMRREKATFSAANPTSKTVKLDISSETLMRFSETSLTIHANTANETAYSSGPSYLIDLLRMVPRNTDLVRIRAAIPYEQTSLSDPRSNRFRLDSGYALIAYDWTDLNSNGLVWHDDVVPNGVVNRGELDEKELNRFAYDAPAADCMEVSVADPLRRAHDGLFIGLQHYQSSPDIPATEIKLTFEFYRRCKWNMLDVVPRKVTLPPGRTHTFQAVFAASPVEHSGVYSGAIKVRSESGEEQTIPVTACVVNPRFSWPPGGLRFCGTDGTRAPYDNGLIRGAYDWGWRPDSGDWRFYFYEPPRFLQKQTKLLANVNWKNYPTDIDALMFAPNRQDYFSNQLPKVFGPYSLVPAGGSVHTNIYGGMWPFFTNTGGSSEWVSAPMGDGLNLGLLHCVLSAGKSAGEPMTGGIGPVTVEPWEIKVAAGQQSTSMLTLTPYLILPQGIEARAFGFVKPTEYVDQPIGQDTPYYPYTARWFRDVTLSGAGLLEVATTSSHDIDIDLYILRDDNGDGAFNWSTELLAVSGDVGADEKLSLVLPADGAYRIAVHGYLVMQPNATFSISIAPIQGSDISVVVPPGPVVPGWPLKLRIDAAVPASGGEGIMLVGPKGAVSAMDVRVRSR